jgi:hypothetical protein
MSAPRVIRLRYAGTCASCAAELAKGTQAQWDGEEKTATCMSCLGPTAVEPEARAAPDLFDLRLGETLAAPPAVPVAGEALEAIDRGVAGGSAAREWKRRHDKREQKIRRRYGKLSGVVLALTEDPQSTSAWAYGANGEKALGKQLDLLREEGVGVLHDRRIPGSRANIDHLVVAPHGVFVIDAKNYNGRVERRDRGGLFSTDYRLYVGNRDRTGLLAGMRNQSEAVRTALAVPREQIPIVQTICFVAADWSLFARPIQFDAVQVLWPRALVKQLRFEGPLDRTTIAEVERRLALALPAA